jgi:hypothetical protein
VAREWQKEDKRLEVRTALVRRLSETTADFIGAARLNATGSVNDRTLDTAYRKWSVVSSSIAGEIAAHVRSDEVKNRWRNYRTNMAHVYYFLRTQDPSVRTIWLKRIAGWWAPGGRNQAGAFLVLNGLLKHPPTLARPNPVYEESLRELLDRLEQRSETIVSLILEAPTTI